MEKLPTEMKTPKERSTLSEFSFSKDEFHLLLILFSAQRFPISRQHRIALVRLPSESAVSGQFSSAYPQRRSVPHYPLTAIGYPPSAICYLLPATCPHFTTKPPGTHACARGFLF